ncbi:MAG TPA: spore maturation protein [Defluviitaleaceae bacterium]|nr:spore maturation protein [Candidatus Epulonipiscium sp.]HQD50145.1 spore maturation protein [Defluviitaleaceae bacterium]
MKWILYISDFMIPLIVSGVIIYGLLKGINIFDVFIEGAKESVKVILTIMPTLIGLMMAVGIIRASGSLNMFELLLKPISNLITFPVELIPLIVLRTISSSASLGLVLDLFKQYGPDSFIGRLVSVMMGCTETIFYTMSVYFMSVGIKKTRYTLAGALIANLAGIIASFYITLFIFGK